jgi:hypothetical protein
VAEEPYRFGNLNTELSYQFNKQTSSFIKTGLIMQFTHTDQFDRNYSTTDTQLGFNSLVLKNYFNKHKSLSLNWGVSGALPNSTISFKRKFKGAVGTNLGLTAKIKKWMISQTLGYRFSLYEFEAQGNEVYSPHSYTSSTSAKYRFTKKFSASASFSYIRSISYNKISKDFTRSSVGINYLLKKNIILNTGFSTENGVLAASGTEYDIKLFGENETMFLVGISFFI